MKQLACLLVVLSATLAWAQGREKVIDLDEVYEHPRAWRAGEGRELLVKTGDWEFHYAADGRLMAVVPKADETDEEDDEQTEQDRGNGNARRGNVKSGNGNANAKGGNAARPATKGAGTATKPNSNTQRPQQGQKPAQNANQPARQ